jgi:MoaA/NifB/PqqE/SkfB family radical SAM enzyme
MKIAKQQAPFTVQIETTEGCNLGCSFCGLKGMREKGTQPWYFMTVETALKIAKEIKRMNWNAKIVFGMHGEPTLNPKFLSIVRIFRKNLGLNLGIL